MEPSKTRLKNDGCVFAGCMLNFKHTPQHHREDIEGQPMFDSVRWYQVILTMFNNTTHAIHNMCSIYRWFVKMSLSGLVDKSEFHACRFIFEFK